MWHERTSFFSANEKKRKKRKDIKKKIIKNKWTNLSIIMVEEQNMSKEIFE